MLIANLIMYCIFIIIFIGLAIVGFICLKVERNKAIGYRTALSLKNDENWYFANKTFGKYLIFLMICMIILVSIYMGIIIIFNYYLQLFSSYIFLGLTIILPISIGILTMLTENKLQKFDRKNNQTEENNLENLITLVSSMFEQYEEGDNSD